MTNAVRTVRIIRRIVPLEGCRRFDAQGRAIADKRLPERRLGIYGPWFDVAQALADGGLKRKALRLACGLPSGHLNHAVCGMRIAGLLRTDGAVLRLTPRGLSRLRESRRLGDVEGMAPPRVGSGGSAGPTTARPA